MPYVINILVERDSIKFVFIRKCSTYKRKTNSIIFINYICLSAWYDSISYISYNACKGLEMFLGSIEEKKNNINYKCLL